MTAAKGTCAVCSQPFVLRMDGRVRNHQDPSGPRGDRPRLCQGVGKLPVEATEPKP